MAARERHLREIHRQRRSAVCLTYVKAPAHPCRSLLMGHTSPPPWPGHGPASPCLPLMGGAVPPAVWTLIKTGPNAYLRAMFKRFDFCIPTKSTSVSVGPGLAPARSGPIYSALPVRWGSKG